MGTKYAEKYLLSQRLDVQMNELFIFQMNSLAHIHQWTATHGSLFPDSCYLADVSAESGKYSWT